MINHSQPTGQQFEQHMKRVEARRNLVSAIGLIACITAGLFLG